MSHFIIAGAKGGHTQGASAPNRLEINDLIKDGDQFSLYIQALIALQATSQNNQLSHFGVGGIHGLPFQQWDGSGGNQPVSGSQWGGYCTHGCVIFPTWHRPYVALYEQLVQQHALTIAQKYREQPRWTNAAQNLRAPYWDWATNSVPPPEVISLPTLNITTPNGNTTAVPNPLLQYRFNPISPSFPDPYSSWQTTIRHPDDPNSPDASTDAQALADDLSSAQNDITTSTYNLLSRVNTWPAFSNHTPGDGGSSSNSLEAIHDSIHGTVGGQMGDPAVAGFDPIFFLHHANVDRLLSLWSAVNPGVWVSNGPAEGGTWTISGNATIGNNTKLEPFWETQSSYWLSSQVTQTSSLTYSYPEFNNLPSDPSSIQAAIGNYINQQYGGGGGGGGGFLQSLFAQPSAPGGAQAQQPVAATQQLFHSRGGHPQATPHGSAPTIVNDWTTRIHFKKYELGVSCAVLIFLGKVPDDPKEWRTAPTYIGSHHSFVNSAASQCDNCRSQGEVSVEGFVHLNTYIAKKSGLSSYEPSEVIPYLKNNLHWRIQAADRTAVEPAKLSSLEVTVVTTPLTHAPGSIFPVAGQPKYEHQITYGRPGGARQT